MQSKQNLYRQTINLLGQKIIKILHKLVINLLGPKIIQQMRLLGPKILQTKQMQLTTNLLGWRIIRIVPKTLVLLVGWKIKRAIIVVLQLLLGWKEATIMPNLIQVRGKVSKLLRFRSKKNNLRKKWRESNSRRDKGKGFKNKEKKKSRSRLILQENWMQWQKNKNIQLLVRNFKKKKHKELKERGFNRSWE